MKFTELDGEIDFENDVRHVEGKGEDYDMGYGMGYQKAENLTSQTIEPPEIEEYFLAELARKT